MVRRIGDILHRHLPTFANMILRAVDLAKDTSGKALIDSVTHLIKTMLARYQNVAFHQTTEVRIYLHKVFVVFGRRKCGRIDSGVRTEATPEAESA